MSKFAYCSIEEAWGESFSDNKNQNNNINNNIQNNNFSNSPSYSNIQSNQNTSRNISSEEEHSPQEQALTVYQRNNSFNRNSTPKFDQVKRKSESDRQSILENMNLIERNKLTSIGKCEDPQSALVNYRMNPYNVVNYYENDKKNSYAPFQESIEKKYLRDKLLFLESELRKYHQMLDQNNDLGCPSKRNVPSYQSEEEEEGSIEHFSNGSSGTSNDFIDLIILIILGLLIIFIMDSIFKLGKTVGARRATSGGFFSQM